MHLACMHWHLLLNFGLSENFPLVSQFAFRKKNKIRNNNSSILEEKKT